MKKYIIILILFMLSFSSVYAVVNSYSLLGKEICLDAGHGGVDSGAVYNQILEKEINLSIVKKMEKELISRGAKVVLTRDDDYDLSTSKNNRRKRSDLKNRAIVINESNCDLYISIHLNYISDSRWRGTQIFYNSNNKNNELLAKIMTKYLRENIGNVRDYMKTSDYYLYRLIKKTGVLVEVGFLSNPDDRYMLVKEKYQNEIALHLVNGISKYF